MKTKQEEKKYNGIKGWLVLPILGFFYDIFILITDLSTDYGLSSNLTYILNVMDVLLILLCIATILAIFYKLKIGKTLAIVTLSISLLGNLYIGYAAGVAGSALWIGYFLMSKRVKQTLIN